MPSYELPRHRNIASQNRRSNVASSARASHFQGLCDTPMGEEMRTDDSDEGAMKAMDEGKGRLDFDSREYCSIP